MKIESNVASNYIVNDVTSNSILGAKWELPKYCNFFLRWQKKENKPYIRESEIHSTSLSMKNGM